MPHARVTIKSVRANGLAANLRFNNNPIFRYNIISTCDHLTFIVNSLCNKGFIHIRRYIIIAINKANIITLRYVKSCITSITKPPILFMNNFNSIIQYSILIT